jgi:myosin heavy subunit
MTYPPLSSVSNPARRKLMPPHPTPQAKERDCIPIWEPSGIEDKVDDLVKLSQVNPAQILHALRLRFQEDRIYTYLGE